MAITVTGSDIEFVTTASEVARARSEVTTTAADDPVTFAFSVERNTLTLRVGSTAGGQEIVNDLDFTPGTWIISLTPGETTYYIEWFLQTIGKATLTGFARQASADLELVTPWAESALASLRNQQSLNYLWVLSPEHEPKIIERRGNTSWGVRSFTPQNGPFRTINTTTTTLTASDNTGEITITASAPLFATYDVGNLLKLTHQGQFETGTLDALDAVTPAIRVSGIDAGRSFSYSITGTFTATIVLERSVGNEVSFETVSSFTTTASSSYNDDLDNEVIYYRFRVSAYTSGSATAEITYSGGTSDGVAKIISVDADNEVTADVLEPITKTSATTDWYWGDWGERFGWPSVVSLHDGRLAFGRVDKYWLSAPDDFEDFDIGASDDDAISRTLTGQLNALRWMQATRRLIAGTAGAEHIIKSGGSEDILTPSTTMSEVIATRGSANAAAVTLDNSVMFISRSGRRIYAITDIDGGTSYQIIDLTRLHPDISGDGGFVELAIQQEPYTRLWAVRADGIVATLLLEGSEGVAAWSRLNLDGVVESVAVLPNTPSDNVYFRVARTVDGVTTRTIEKLADEAFDTSSDACRLWSAVYHQNVSSVAFPSHLAGHSVYVWADGREIGPFTEADDPIALGDTYEKVWVGLLYEGRYTSARLDYGGSRGSVLTQNKKVTDLGIVPYRTVGGGLGYGQDYASARLNLLPDRREGEAFDAPLSEYSDVQRLPLRGSIGLDSRVCIVMPGAGPAAVLAIVPYIDVNER